ncbi:MAG: hypothetical protein WB566_17025 [Terriglobales bacterium]
MPLGFSAVVSVVSLAVSVTVAWLTLFRRGTLRMTQPVQIAFVYENDKPKIFLRTLMYATGKRGFVIEGLYLRVKQPDSTQTYGFWAYGERNSLTVAGGLRVTEEGVSYNHHFLKIGEGESGWFPEGDYEISVYVRPVNRKSPKLLMSINVGLTDEEATRLHLQRGALFTWNPDTGKYHASFEKKS